MNWDCLLNQNHVIVRLNRVVLLKWLRWIIIELLDLVGLVTKPDLFNLIKHVKRDLCLVEINGQSWIINWI